METIVLTKTAGHQPGSLLSKVFRGFQDLVAILVRREQLLSRSRVLLLVTTPRTTA